MAKKQGLQETGKVTTSSFIKGLNKDSDPSFVSEGMWTHAVNAVNNTIEGDIGTVSQGLAYSIGYIKALLAALSV